MAGRNPRRDAYWPLVGPECQPIFADIVAVSVRRRAQPRRDHRHSGDEPAHLTDAVMMAAMARKGSLAS